MAVTVLKHISEATVVGPEKLREEVKGNLEKALIEYGSK